MSIREFQSLNKEEQHKKTIEIGQFIQFKVFQKEVHALYSVQLFFVDLQYHKFRLNKITAFEEGTLLDIYSGNFLNLD